MDMEGTLRKINGTFGCGCRSIGTAAIEVRGGIFAFRESG
jgi:hypothetical protein